MTIDTSTWERGLIRIYEQFTNNVTIWPNRMIDQTVADFELAVAEQPHGYNQAILDAARAEQTKRRVQAE